MKPTRRTQPHRRGASRQPSTALDAMTRGRGMYEPAKAGKPGSRKRTRPNSKRRRARKKALLQLLLGRK